jgi:hypothetical protein
VKRLFWVGVGVAVTVVVLRQVSKASTRVGDVARAVSPAGVAASIGSLAEAVTTLGTQLRESMAEHEDALRTALLPPEEDLARARETRAARHRREDRAPGLEEDDVLPGDDIDYF